MTPVFYGGSPLGPHHPFRELVSKPPRQARLPSGGTFFAGKLLGHLRSMTTIAPGQPLIATSASPDRWLRFLIVSCLLNLMCFLLFPQVYTDCATPAQLLLCVGPAVWGLHVFLSFRTKKERIVGYVFIVPA